MDALLKIRERPELADRLLATGDVMTPRDPAATAALPPSAVVSARDKVLDVRTRHAV